jgi:hypothetical protein
VHYSAISWRFRAIGVNNQVLIAVWDLLRCMTTEIRILIADGGETTS